MWVVAKIKYNQLEIFKKELEKKIKNKPIYYLPKIKVEKNQKTKISN